MSPKASRYDQMIKGDARALKRTPLIASALDNPDMRPSIQRLRDQFSTVWEVSSLSLRIHMVEQGMGVTFMDRKLLREHPTCTCSRSWTICPLVVSINRWACTIAPARASVTVPGTLLPFANASGTCRVKSTRGTALFLVEGASYP